LSTYQAFAFLWHLSRDDIDAARIVASMPPECFRRFDEILEAAFTLGFAMKAKH